jgi:hypothetical protein
MTHRKALESWEVTPQTIWPTEKSQMDRPKATTAIHGPLRFTFHLLQKVNVNADCFEISSQPMTCVTKTKRVRLQALLEPVDT